MGWVVTGHSCSSFFARIPPMVPAFALGVLLSVIASAQPSRQDPFAIDDGETVFYHGSVGKFEIRLSLEREVGGFSGSYQYATQSTSLHLEGNPLPNGKLAIAESQPSKSVSGEFVFDGSPGEKQLAGNWRSAEGKRSYTVRLVRIFQQQYEELPKTWSARPKSAVAQVLPPFGPVLKTLQQIEEPVLAAEGQSESHAEAHKTNLRGPDGISLVATVNASDFGTVVHIWNPVGSGFRLLHEIVSANVPTFARYEVEGFRFSGEYFLHLAHVYSGTGYFHDDNFLWIAPDATLHSVKFSAPASEYSGLREGEGVWKGEANDFHDDGATFEFCIWKDGDANCCPSAGRVKGIYKLTGGKHFDSETKQWSGHFQIAPANFTRLSPETQ
jgi:hypothetical protein